MSTNLEPPPKRSRGRPPKKPQDIDNTKLRQQSLNLQGSGTNDDMVGQKRGRSVPDYADDDESSGDGDIIQPFISTGGSHDVIVRPIPKPEFKGEQHMWFQTTQVTHMATLFKCLSRLLTSSEIMFYPEGWRILAVNSKQSALISLRVTEHTLEEGIYDCDATYRICVDLEELSHRISICRKADIMTICLRGDPQLQRPQHLSMNFSSDNTLTDMQLKLRTPEPMCPSLPEIDYHSKWDLPAEKFKEKIHALKGDTLITVITFKQYAGKRFTMSVESKHGPINMHFFADDTNVKFFEQSSDSKSLLPTSNNAEDLTEEDEKNCIKYSFALNEILGFTTITKAAKWVRLCMPEDRVIDGVSQPKPLKMTYSIAALGEISFYLAPKIEDEGDE
jgi:hypothetical protein